LYDVSQDGRLLLTSENSRIGISALVPSETKERDLSWLDGSWARDISQDGKTLLLDEENEGGGEIASVYLRRTDGSPAVRLGNGHAMALSPDGKWALAHLRYTKPQQIVLLPTGAGESRVLVSDATNYFEIGSWFSDSKRVLLRAREPGRGSRCYEQSIEGGDPRPLLQEGLSGRLISPDGKSIIASARQQKRAIYPLDGGAPRPLAGLEDQDYLLSWGADERFLYVSQGMLPAKVYKIDLTTGRRDLLREIMPADPAGLLFVAPPVMSPDGQSYAYTYFRVLNQLFLVDVAD
jgi:Tol biopolymer transport system component